MTNYLNHFVIFFTFAISNLSTSDFKLAKSTFLAKDDVLTPVAVFKFIFVAEVGKSN